MEKSTGAGAEVNKLSSEDITDYDNLSLRALLTEKGIVAEGDILTADDYEAIRNRATVLVRESSSPLSAEAALLAACVDRLQLVEKIGMETLKGMSVDSLRAVFYAETGIMFTDDEINLFKSSPLPINSWIEQRSEIRETLH